MACAEDSLDNRPQPALGGQRGAARRGRAQSPRTANSVSFSSWRFITHYISFDYK